MTIEEKLRSLNIQTITDDFYLEHIKDWELRGVEVSQFKYYKMFGEKAMLYTEGYIEDTPYNELLSNHKRFDKQHGFFGRLKLKVQSKLLRWGI